MSEEVTKQTLDDVVKILNDIGYELEYHRNLYTPAVSGMPEITNLNALDPNGDNKLKLEEMAEAVIQTYYSGMLNGKGAACPFHSTEGRYPGIMPPECDGHSKRAIEYGRACPCYEDGFLEADKVTIDNNSPNSKLNLYTHSHIITEANTNDYFPMPSISQKYILNNGNFICYSHTYDRSNQSTTINLYHINHQTLEVTNNTSTTVKLKFDYTISQYNSRVKFKLHQNSGNSLWLILWHYDSSTEDDFSTYFTVYKITINDQGKITIENQCTNAKLTSNFTVDTIKYYDVLVDQNRMYVVTCSYDKSYKDPEDNQLHTYLHIQKIEFKTDNTKFVPVSGTEVKLPPNINANNGFFLSPTTGVYCYFYDKDNGNSTKIINSCIYINQNQSIVNLYDVPEITSTYNLQMYVNNQKTYIIQRSATDIKYHYVAISSKNLSLITLDPLPMVYDSSFDYKINIHGRIIMLYRILSTGELQIYHIPPETTWDNIKLIELSLPLYGQAKEYTFINCIKKTYIINKIEGILYDYYEIYFKINYIGTNTSCYEKYIISLEYPLLYRAIE